MKVLRRTALSLLIAGSGLALTSGCSSVMTHTGPHQGYYSGTRANMDALHSEDASWAMTPLVILDMPFSAVMDTLLLPYDYSRSGKEKPDDSLRARIHHDEHPPIIPASAIQPSTAHP